MRDLLARRLQKQPQGVQTLTDKEPDPFRKARESVAQTIEAEAMRKMIKGEPSTPPPVQETPTSLVTKSMEMQKDMYAAELEARRAAERTKDATIEKYFKSEADRIEEKRLELQNINPTDPALQSITTIEKVIGFWEGFKQKLSAGDGTKPLVTTPMADGATLISLKKLEVDSLANHDQLLLVIQKMEDERLARKIEHDDERDEAKRKQEQDDRRWWAEFDLKKEDVGRSKGVQEKAANTFSDAVVGLMASIDHDMGGVEAGASVSRSVQRVQPQREPSSGVGAVFRPKVFKCSGISNEGTPCATMINVPADIDEVTCPKCGAIYDIVPLSEVNSPPIQSPNINREVTSGHKATQGGPTEIRQADVSNFPGQTMEPAEFMAALGPGGGAAG